MAMIAWNKRDTGLILLALAWLAITLNFRPLALPDEGRYVGVAWEMLTSGNWLYPTLDGLPFFHKPPLFYWITASSLSVFGVHEWAGRLASLLGAGLAAFSLYRFSLRWHGRTVARWSLLILVTQPIFFAGAQFANLDMLVAGFISLTVLLASEAVLNANRQQAYKGLLAGAYASAALGILAKGLIGIALPGMIVVIWLAWSKRLNVLRQLVWLPGLALFSLIAVPWFAAMQMHFPDFLNYFFVYNHFQRFTESGFNNPMPFWFYLPVVLLLTLPWSWWLPGALKNNNQARRDGWRTGQLDVTPLMWIWLAVIIGFFSIPSSKLVGYVLPALPPLAYLIAAGLASKWGNETRLPRPMKWFVAVAVLVCLSALLANNRFNTKTNKELAELIADQRQVGEPVVFLNNQFFDLPFYLGLREPVKIFDDWNLSLSSQRDNWQKALIDAGKFDPKQAKSVLLDRTQIVQELCANPVSWVIALKGQERNVPYLQPASLVAQRAYSSVWKVSQVNLAAKGLCPGMPIVGSVDK
jgi:4-amino-4-deoxy-L-arabinose transferase-like glycosyltransferase